MFRRKLLLVTLSFLATVSAISFASPTPLNAVESNTTNTTDTTDISETTETTDTSLELQQALDAGFSQEQYDAIMSIPDLPDVDDLSPDTPSTRATSPTDQQKVVNEAKKYLGIPYVWGGTTPNGFDCSGLVQYVYSRAVGINLPRVTTQQEYSGKDISLNSIAAGDLLFYGARGSTYHVAICIGNGQAIHAPKPGDVVRIFNISSFYPSFARRVLKDDYVPGPTVKGSIDKVYLDSYTYTISGWLTSTDDIRSATPYLFFMDASTNKEIARTKMERRNRPDVEKVHPTVNGSNVGWEVSGQTPSNLVGKKYKIMVRYASDSLGDKGVAQINFPDLFVGPAHGRKADTIGLRRGSILHFKYTLQQGEADYFYNYGLVSDEAFAGDWNGDGQDTIALRRGTRFYIKDKLQQGEHDYDFIYGKASDQVLVGDWDGDGKDTFALRRGNEIFIKNSLQAGEADFSFTFGEVDDQIFVGDWDGDGKDTFAIRRGTRFHIMNTLQSENADHTFVYGKADDKVYIGDWDADGKDTIALRRGSVFHFKNSLQAGEADFYFNYGKIDDYVLIGDWDGN